jgi:hypothetical protein
MERAIKEIANSTELANLYQDIAKNLLDKDPVNNADYLFLISLEKSLSYFADEIFEKTKSLQTTSIQIYSCEEKWKKLSEIDTIRNLILPEIEGGGVIYLIGAYQNTLISPIDENLISTDASIDLKKLNLLLDSSYRWIDLLRKTLDEC